MTQRRYRAGGFDLAVKRASAGLGLFAAAPIPKDACIIEYLGTPLTEEQKYTSRSRYLFEVNSRLTLDGSPRWNKARYMNHSCEPNCEAEVHRSRVFIFALRDITAGEELVYDYGETYVDAYLKGKCLCAKCVPPVAKVAAAARPTGGKVRKQRARAGA